MISWYLSRRVMAASRASSRRATCNFWTRSVVRVKSTRPTFENGAILDQAEADGGGQMGFAPAGRAEQDQVGACLQPAVSGDKRYDTGFGNGWNGVEVEAGQGLARRQAGFGEVALDPPLPAFSDLVFGEGCKQPRGGPAFLVGPFSEAGPEVLDGWQAQFIEQEVQTRRVDGIRGGHAASPVGTAAKRAL